MYKKTGAGASRTLFKEKGSQGGPSWASLAGADRRGEAKTPAPWTQHSALRPHRPLRSDHRCDQQHHSTSLVPDPGWEGRSPAVYLGRRRPEPLLIFTGGGAGREVNVYPKCVRGNTFILTSWGKEGDAVQAAKGSTSLTLSPRGAPHTHSYPRSCWLGPGLF